MTFPRAGAYRREALLRGKLVRAVLSLQYRAVASPQRPSRGQIALPSAFARTQPEISQSPFGARRKL